ncbi:MAG: hypothetical protein H7A50_11925 [Akkermansiaceae bacterium]|nr:hypothetical protein [Akkermansiaceae bacterium]
MKRLAYLLPVAGFLCGWILSHGNTGPEPGRQELPVEPSVVEAERIGYPNEAGVEAPARLKGDEVWVRRDQLRAIASASSGWRMRMDDEGFACVSALSAKVPMSVEETQRLRALLETASRERFEWERANVKVEMTGPAEWTLRFPGDGGGARQQLRAGIEKILGPERTRQVDLYGNIDGFFGMKWIAPELRHGDIRVRAKVHKAPDPHRSMRLFERTILSVAIGDAPAQRIQLDDASLQTEIVIQRILPLLGGESAVRKAAAGVKP